jgi:hypothetical protein
MIFSFVFLLGFSQANSNNVELLLGAAIACSKSFRKEAYHM